jgi:hypothetical protein
MQMGSGYHLQERTKDEVISNFTACRESLSLWHRMQNTFIESITPQFRLERLLITN